MSETQGIEYSVYIYHYPTGQSSGGDAPKWEMTKTTDSMDQALKAAQSLFDSRRYQKVEVKKRFFDEKNKRNVDMTLKMFEGKARGKPVGTGLWLLLAISCGVGAFGATLMVVQFLK